ncbi:MAG: ABC transporter permease [Planctomycetes bacterium]|nr:ABC transporter permease [Planctomycetota bacterium]
MAAWVSHIADRLFGPVFTLDATRVGRRLSTFVIRWLYLLVLVSVLGGGSLAWRYSLDTEVVHPSVLSQFAESFFWAYSILQFLIITALTPAFTAAAITDEKERKTLHFLLATDLTGREIIFGKLAARVGALLTLVIAGLPIIAFMQLFGGIEPRLLLVSVGMTIATVVCLSATSVAVSVMMFRTRDAVILAYALPIAYLCLSFTAWESLKYSVTLWDDVFGVDSLLWGDVLLAFCSGNPFVAMDFAPAFIPKAAVWYVAFNAVVAILAFAFAALRIRRAVNNEGAVRRQRKVRTHPPLGDDPMYWREVYVESGTGNRLVRRLLIFGLLALIWLPFIYICVRLLSADSFDPRSRYSYTSWRFNSPWHKFRDGIEIWVCAVTWIVGMLMMLRATVRGAASVAGERDRDTWVSLTATTLTVEEILRGKWVGCMWGQRDAMILLGVVWTIGVLVGVIGLSIFVLVALALAVYLNAFTWLGICCSVTALNSRVAIANAVMAALLRGGVYWIMVACCFVLIGFVRTDSVFGDVATFIAGLTPPLVIAVFPIVENRLVSNLLELSENTAPPRVLGMVVGLGLWSWIAKYWKRKALSLCEKDTNSSTSPTASEGRRQIVA